MCGTNGNLKKTKVEGTILEVCQQCAKFGKELQSPKFFPKKNKLELQEEVIPNYGKVIRQKREELKMMQEHLAKRCGLKVSLIQRIETQQLTLALDTAKKLETALKIKLLEKEVSQNIEIKKEKFDALTIGDIIKKN